MKNIKQLIEKIKVNEQVIGIKTSELLNIKIKEVNDILDIAFKYLTFDKIENLELTHFNAEYGNLLFFQNLCQHAILLDNLIDVNRVLTPNSIDKYELWLLWNKEFCVIRLKSIPFNTANKSIEIREVIDYGDCAFKVHNGTFIWNMDNIINNIEDNLKTTLASKENIRQFIELELNKIKD
ncbi:hypothetical protein SAMN02745163_03193 [Clostridium cavendishii DSM 21758]|uniref:Uncharacterized protein n=1 Tax=Clostridium cavendishii DSM 21758 TaxID=1121302 RepID=A0A1M6PLL4_9CLOT|nr:hypothetical protein [Clostridium cavendishii]SHK08832.1 hypothetical protein SAMN02745163_03193 [Clostridium cavendishii DSM 21758]